MKAYDFEFAGQLLSSYGMILCSFGDKGLETISDGSQVSFNTISTLGGLKHELTSATYEDCLETTLQICKNPCNNSVMELSDTEYRQLKKWLSRKRFLKFKILGESYIDVYFEAAFNISRIEIDGRLYGLELEVKTNAPHALKEPRIINIICNDDSKVYGWEKYFDGSKLGCVTSGDSNAYPSGVHTDGFQYVPLGEVYKHSINDISHEEGHIYPYTEITVSQDGDLKIHNVIENRDTYIANCKVGEVIIMDYPVISSSDSSHDIQNDFNWNFFRVANTFDNSRNDLIVSLPCSIKVEYSPIVKVGL